MSVSVSVARTTTLFWRGSRHDYFFQSNDGARNASHHQHDGVTEKTLAHALHLRVRAGRIVEGGLGIKMKGGWFLAGGLGWLVVGRKGDYYDDICRAFFRVNRVGVQAGSRGASKNSQMLNSFCNIMYSDVQVHYLV